MAKITFWCNYGSHMVEYDQPDWGGAGYAYWGDPKVGEKMCYPCAAERERQLMIELGRTCLYYTKSAHRPKVANWTGLLSFRAINWHERKVFNPIGGYMERIDVDFVGPDSHIWHGVCMGNSQLLHCRVTSEVANICCAEL